VGPAVLCLVGTLALVMTSDHWGLSSKAPADLQLAGVIIGNGGRKVAAGIETAPPGSIIGNGSSRAADACFPLNA
jgi:hypothetical protein